MAEVMLCPECLHRIYAHVECAKRILKEQQGPGVPDAQAGRALLRSMVGRNALRDELADLDDEALRRLGPRRID